MKDRKEVTSLGRRDFFRKAGLGAGAVGSVAVGLGGAKAQAGQPGERSVGSVGYRETKHVKKFYELARF